MSQKTLDLRDYNKLAKIQKIPFLSNDAFQNRMAQSEEIVNCFHLQTGLADKADKIVGMIHLAVTISDSRKVEAGLGETQGRSVETLTIP